MKHGSFLLKGVVVAFTPAEPIPKVLIVFVVGVGLFGMHAALSIRLRVDAKGTRAGRRETRRSAIAGEVALGEDFDEGVFSVALNGTGIADTGGLKRLGGILGRWRASHASEDGLPEGAKQLGTSVDALRSVLGDRFNRY